MTSKAWEAMPDWTPSDPQGFAPLLASENLKFVVGIGSFVQLELEWKSSQLPLENIEDHLCSVSLALITAPWL